MKLTWQEAEELAVDKSKSVDVWPNASLMCSELRLR